MMEGQGQEITAKKAKDSHQECGRVKTEIQLITFAYKSIKTGKQELSEKDAASGTEQKCGDTQNQAFSPENFRDLPPFHSQKKICGKLPASFAHHKTDHILKQPGQDQEDKEGCYAEHYGHYSGIILKPADIWVEQKPVEGKHDRCNQKQSDKKYKIIPPCTLCVAETQFNQHD
jgi:hypothetical protein